MNIFFHWQYWILTTDWIKRPYKILHKKNLAEIIPEESVWYLKNLNKENFFKKLKLLLTSFSQISWMSTLKINLINLIILINLINTYQY